MTHSLSQEKYVLRRVRERGAVSQGNGRGLLSLGKHDMGPHIYAHFRGGKGVWGLSEGEDQGTGGIRVVHKNKSDSGFWNPYNPSPIGGR